MLCIFPHLAIGIRMILKLALPVHEESNGPGPERKHDEEDDNFTRLDKTATAGDGEGAVVGYRSNYNR